MKKIYLYIILGFLLLGSVTAGVTIGTEIYDGITRDKTTPISMLAELDEIQIERYKENGSERIVMRIDIPSKDYIEFFEYSEDELPNSWELVLAIQENREENNLLKSELCLKDITYSWCR